MIFEDRREAGRRLASLLGFLEPEDPVVLALPRGGVPVAVEVAAALGAALDVLPVRKLGAPGRPEFAIGAIAEDGTAVLDAVTAERIGVTEQDVDRVLRAEVAELRRRIAHFRRGRPPVDVRGRTVVIVDDGLATGLTDLAAVRAARRRGAERIIVAAPVASREAVVLLRPEADEVICHTVPRELLGVGRWYRDFSPVPDREVLRLLAEARRGSAPGGGAPERRSVEIAVGEGVLLPAELSAASEAWGFVLLAGLGGEAPAAGSRPPLASLLNAAGLATLSLELTTTDERDGRRGADVEVLAGRLVAATRWVAREPEARGLPIGYAAGPGAAAATLAAAAVLGEEVRAVVSTDGRPDLARGALDRVTAPTLLMVEGAGDALEAARRASVRLRGPHRISRGDGDEAGRLAVDWLGRHLPATGAPAAAAG
jgi:putative phosphoribosyl transferase